MIPTTAVPLPTLVSFLSTSSLSITPVTALSEVTVVLSSEELLKLHRITDSFVIKHHNSQLQAFRKNVKASSGRGCEVFVNQLPRDILLKNLYFFMATCGEVDEIRLMIEFSGYSKGMAFVKYSNKDSAKMASLVLHGCEIQPGCLVTIKMSFDNNKLMLSLLPKHVTEEQLFQEMQRNVGNGLLSATLVADSDENNGNRAILVYKTHKQALDAKKILWPSTNLWNSLVLVEWAEPQDLKLARMLYFRNFPEDKTRFDLFKVLRQITNIDSLIKIHVDRGIGYIVFSTGRYREMTVDILQECYIYGRKLELSTTKKFYRPYYTNLQGKINKKYSLSNGDQLQRIESPIDDRRTCFDFITDDIPTYHTIPVYTQPGIYNELDAIKQIVHNFLHKRFPFTVWTILDSDQYQGSQHPPVIRVMLTVNNVKYTFLLVQVPNGQYRSESTLYNDFI